MANTDANQEQPQPQLQEPPQAPKQPPHEEPGQKPLKLKFGPLEIEGQLSIVSGLIGGLILGGVAIFYLAVFQGQPAFIVGPILKEKYSASLTAQPTLTPQPPKTVEVTKTVPVEVVTTVEVTKTVEVVQTVIETVERTVTVPVTVTVIVTPTPPSPPKMLNEDIEEAFNYARDYLVSGGQTDLPDIWWGKKAITDEIKMLLKTFSNINPESTYWRVEEFSELGQDQGVAVYTLQVKTVLTITGTYNTCDGQETRGTMHITYPSIIRAEIQNLTPNMQRVRIWSWTKDPDQSICPSGPN